MSSAELSGAATTDDESVTSGQVISNILSPRCFNFSTSAHPGPGTKQPAKGTVRQFTEAQSGSSAPDEEGEKDPAEVKHFAIRDVAKTSHKFTKCLSLHPIHQYQEKWQV